MERRRNRLQTHAVSDAVEATENTGRSPAKGKDWRRPSSKAKRSHEKGRRRVLGMWCDSFFVENCLLDLAVVGVAPGDRPAIYL